MKQKRENIFLGLFCCVALVLFAGDASAADLFGTLRSKAMGVLSDLKPVIFILAGFGLIGFAFGAIFNKISWKWFANIAIGLFLVANMGLFIDYFAGKTGAYTKIDTDYGDHMKPGYNGQDGSSDAPEKQKPESDSGNAKDPEGCVPGTGVNCGGENPVNPPNWDEIGGGNDFTLGENGQVIWGGDKNQSDEKKSDASSSSGGIVPPYAPPSEKDEASLEKSDSGDGNKNDSNKWSDAPGMNDGENAGNIFDSIANGESPWGKQ